MSADPVGSLAEEATRLLAALSSLSAAGGGRDAGSADDPDAVEPDSYDGHDEHEGHDPSAPECRYCPLCALARAARSVTPEVREHLASAATSFAMALRGFVEEAVEQASARPPEGRGGTPVEKIDLADD